MRPSRYSSLADAGARGGKNRGIGQQGDVTRPKPHPLCDMASEHHYLAYAHGLRQGDCSSIRIDPRYKSQLQNRPSSSEASESATGPWGPIEQAMTGMQRHRPQAILGLQGPDIAEKPEERVE